MGTRHKNKTPPQVLQKTKRAVSAVVRTLEGGGVILHPTDTIYGLAADATNPKAVAKVKAIKGRAEKKPLIVLVSDLAMLYRYAWMTPVARKIIERCDKRWPVTLVLWRITKSLSAAQAEDTSIAFRIPADDFCRSFISKLSRPVVSTSANFSGEPYDGDSGAVVDRFKDSVDLCVVGGTLSDGRPSTILDLRTNFVDVLRYGTIPKEVLIELMDT